MCGSLAGFWGPLGVPGVGRPEDGLLQNDRPSEASSHGERVARGVRGSQATTRMRAGPSGQGCAEHGHPDSDTPLPSQAHAEPPVTSGASEVVPRVLSGEPQNLCLCSLSLLSTGQEGWAAPWLAGLRPGGPPSLRRGALACPGVLRGALERTWGEQSCPRCSPSGVGLVSHTP